MTRFFTVFLIIFLAFSCSGKRHSNTSTFGKNSATKSTKKSSRVTSKILRHIPPSEAMQAGVPLDSDDSIYSSEDRVELSSDTYEGHYKVGNPYEVFGVSYIPQNYEDFQEVGVASWYGDDFHGRRTANGEYYDMESMTAAHRTLPLPSLVRVTNLRNEKSVVVRVNDRGPFSKSRVIDVSQKAAEALGFKDDGTTEVKVELLRDETEALLEKLNLKQ